MGFERFINRNSGSRHLAVDLAADSGRVIDRFGDYIVERSNVPIAHPTLGVAESGTWGDTYALITSTGSTAREPPDVGSPLYFLRPSGQPSMARPGGKDYPALILT